MYNRSIRLIRLRLIEQIFTCHYATESSWVPSLCEMTLCTLRFLTSRGGHVVVKSEARNDTLIYIASFLNKDNLVETKWRDHFKTLVKIVENCPFLLWQLVNSRKKHVKWVSIRAETHGSTAIETSKIYTFTYKIPR